MGALLDEIFSDSDALIIKDEDYSDESSEVTSIDSNIYEVIEHAKAREHSEVSDQGFLYLSISRGRRNHLKLHRFVDWDKEIIQEEEGGGHSRLMKILTQNSTDEETKASEMLQNEPLYLKSKDDLLKKSERIYQPNNSEMNQNVQTKSKKLNLKKSLSRTLSSIVVSIRKLF